MVVMTIPQMNQKLQQVSLFFTSRCKAFTHKIQLHEGSFRQEDFTQFERLLEQIKHDAMDKIRIFFQQRFNIRSSTYETEISSFQGDGDRVKDQLQAFRESLIKATLETKQQQNRKENLMEFFSQKLRRHILAKKCFKLWRAYEIQCKIEKTKNARMDEIYRKNLMKKSFFPWRTLTYKDGYTNSVRREADKDIYNIQDQYKGIIEILKQKIRDTDQLIKVKKVAKGEFAFALSKNLLKSISNLSLEVMNLNQMALRDGEWSEEGTNNFMRQVDTVIKQKIIKVRQYRQGLIQGEITEDLQGIEKKRKHISFA